LVGKKSRTLSYEKRLEQTEKKPQTKQETVMISLSYSWGKHQGEAIPEVRKPGIRSVINPFGIASLRRIRSHKKHRKDGKRCRKCKAAKVGRKGGSTKEGLGRGSLRGNLTETKTGKKRERKKRSGEYGERFLMGGYRGKPR